MIDRLLYWIENPEGRKRPELAFTAGPERCIADLWLMMEAENAKLLADLDLNASEVMRLQGELSEARGEKVVRLKDCPSNVPGICEGPPMYCRGCVESAKRIAETWRAERDAALLQVRDLRKAMAVIVGEAANGREMVEVAEAALAGTEKPVGEKLYHKMIAPGVVGSLAVCGDVEATHFASGNLITCKGCAEKREGLASKKCSHKYVTKLKPGVSVCSDCGVPVNV